MCNIQSIDDAWSDRDVLVWLRDSPADCSVGGNMKLDKGQTKKCRKCGWEMDKLRSRNGYVAYWCGECGSVSKNRGKK